MKSKSLVAVVAVLLTLLPLRAAETLDTICGPAALIAPVELPLTLKKGEHVVFIGNGLFEQMQEHGSFEAMLFQRFPTHELVLRTLAWSADEVNLMPRPDEFGDLHTHLEAQKADVILAAFGFNESFKGVEAVPEFERNLARLITSLKTHKYNGKSAPRIVLVSPVAFESLGAPLPDGVESNVRLAAYTKAMAKVAKSCRVGFVDAFTPTLTAMQAPNKKTKLTYNGIHLTDVGYQVFAENVFREMFHETAPEPQPAIKAAVEDKNRQFFRRYRALNAFYIYGGRAKPYGVVNFPGELQKFDEILANRDRYLWALAQGKPAKLDDSNTTKLPAITGDRPINEWMTPADELKAFNVDPRFEVNLFASEEQFPDLANPIQMRWDNRGRLWVSCSTTYPQVYPGEEPNDKIIILEDTDGDGRADKCSVFATGLQIPLSFEFGNGGVYVSEQPKLSFIKDTDGDGKADLHQTVMTGFGTEDSHHALHDMTWSPEGDLIFRESIFHHSQVETPHGPVRARESSFFRYQPDTRKLTAFGSYRSTNPWGIAFDKWGWHLGSHPVFASAVHAMNAPYPDIHVSAGLYFPAYSGTCGQDFIESRHFPDDLQDSFFRVRYKPVNTVEIHRWVEKDTHYEEERTGHLLQSSNLSFIPVDAQFGPRGDFYICDWYNPVKGHMQYSLRDTRRDRTSGRIWRVTAKGRPLLDPPKIEGATIPALLDLLKAHESRVRYWARRELRERDHAEVKTALDKWVKALDTKDKNFREQQVEALWVYQGVRGVNYPLLREVIACENQNARAAATRQLRWWHAGMADAEALLRKSANDPNGLVRLEAAMTASYFGTPTALEAALEVLKYPMDNYLTYALRTAIDSAPLKPHWSEDAAYITARPLFVNFLSASSRPPGKGKAGVTKTVKKTEKPDPFDQLNPQTVMIGCEPERMMFTVTEFKVKAGGPVKLTLKNPDATPHNLVICKPGTADDIGAAANEMAKLPDAFEKMDFLPKSPNVLFATKMVLENRSETLRFHAPKEKGSYPFICSFPGHYLVMRGVMIVE